MGQCCRNGCTEPTILEVCVLSEVLTILLVEPPQLDLVGFMLGLLLQPAGSGNRGKEITVVLCNRKLCSGIHVHDPVTESAGSHSEQLESYENYPLSAPLGTIWHHNSEKTQSKYWYLVFGINIRGAQRISYSCSCESAKWNFRTLDTCRPSNVGQSPHLQAEMLDYTSARFVDEYTTIYLFPVTVGTRLTKDRDRSNMYHRFLYVLWSCRTQGSCIIFKLFLLQDQNIP